MKKLTSILLVLVITVSLVGCGEKESGTKPENKLEQEVETSGELTNDNTEEDKKTIKPIESAINLKDFGDTIFPVSLNYGDIFMEDDIWKIRVTVYDYEKFKADDIKELTVGDTIVLNEKEVLVNEIETQSSGLVLINGGLEKDGCELYTDDKKVYYEQGYSDTKSYFVVGPLELELVKDFKVIDESKDSKHPTIFDLNTAAFLMNAEDNYYNPHNTYLTTEDSKGFELRIIYTP